MTESPRMLEVEGLEFSYRPEGNSASGWQGWSRRLAAVAEGPVPAASRNGLFHLGPVSFELRGREFLSIIGPNGSGKTTLLSLVGGLLRPARGRVTFEGHDLSALTPRERARRIAYVRQEAPLIFPIRVEQFILLGRFPFTDRLGFESVRDREMAAWAMDATTLRHLASRRMDEISGGERQRAVLARALAQEPELLLMDEPTANLDINFQVELLRLIRRLAEKQGFAVAAVMHELNLAAEFSDHVLLLKDGRLFRFGEPAEVLTREALEETYGLPVSVDRNPYSGRPRVTLAATR